jgi:hypothetical protein
MFLMANAADVVVAPQCWLGSSGGKEEAQGLLSSLVLRLDGTGIEMEDEALAENRGEVLDERILWQWVCGVSMRRVTVPRLHRCKVQDCQEQHQATKERKKSEEHCK